MTEKHKKLYSVDEDFAGAIARAEELYYGGGLFIYPTDTVYGFGANPFNADVVDRVGYVKRRPKDKRYILLAPDIETTLRHAVPTSERHIDALMAAWPNPLSAVLRLNRETRELLGQDTAAFRIPDHRFCRKLLETINAPLISTSANRRGEEPTTEPSIVEQEFRDEVDAIFYEEKRSFAESSTLVDMTEEEPRLIREGKMPFETILEIFAKADASV
ncbi:MAG: threonylcarbamoyl-AMP synthase [Ignavibacteriales bacterium]|nr:threonylcarbamoyl-AMP synthase [Ignavibacteriales bacterium]